MPVWTPDIRRELAPLALRPEREREIAEELAAHLEDRYCEALGRGATDAEARAVALAELHFERHCECFSTGAQSKKLIESHSSWHSATGSGRGIVPEPPPTSPVSPPTPPHFDSMSPHAFLFTQSIWYW